MHRTHQITLTIGLVLAVLATASCSGRPAAGEPTTTAASATPAPPDPVAAVAGFLDDPSASTLRTAVASIGPEDDLAVVLSATLDRLGAETGRTTIAAPIGFNQHRQVTIRTPVGYDPARPWPLIIAYHSWGGSADRMIDRLEAILGPEIESFVVAAPQDYRQTVLDAPPPVSAEHVSIWREVATRRHVDPNRIYTMGYSLGGDTVVTTAAFHGHRIAGGVAWAASPAFPPDVAGMFEWFAPNLAAAPILHVWGSEDDLNIPGLNFRRSTRRLAELDREFSRIAADVPGYVGIEVQGADHGTIRPPLDETLTLLAAPRGEVPTTIHHLFRYIHQADTPWVEGHEWSGPAWLAPWPTPAMEAGSLSAQEEAEILRALVGSIDASASENRIDVTTEHLSDLTIWLLDDVVDLDRPVTVVWNGAVVFEGPIGKDVGVALVQAERTRDFLRLRWAGVRIVDGEAHAVTTEDVFPPVARGVVAG